MGVSFSPTMYQCPLENLVRPMAVAREVQYPGRPSKLSMAEGMGWRETEEEKWVLQVKGGAAQQGSLLQITLTSPPCHREQSLVHRGQRGQ
jgi:hypothetical protein